jgi:aminomethyltransferase
VGDIAGLADGRGCLSLVTNERGGIIDDTVITNAGDFVYMVVNGATKFGDMKHFQEQLDDFKGDVTMEYLEDTLQLLALQGPGAATAVAKLLPSGFDLASMEFMTGADTTLDGIPGCRITRYVDTSEMIASVFLITLIVLSTLLTHTRIIFQHQTDAATRAKMVSKLPCPPNTPSRLLPNS